MSLGRNSVQDTLRCEVRLRAPRTLPSVCTSLPSRYACLFRLLADDDCEYLRNAGFAKESALMRKQHRRMYLRLLRHLEKDTMLLLARREQAMILAGDAATIQHHLMMKTRVRTTFATLRFAALLHALHVRACLGYMRLGVAGVEAMFQVPSLTAHSSN